MDYIFIMISEEQKYLADVYKLSGFALMSPFGRFILFLSDIYSSYKEPKPILIAHLLLSLVLFICGIIMIQKGYEEV